MPYFFTFIFLVLLVPAGPALSGYHSVTSPSDCPAMAEAEAGDARPAIHYLEKSYRRCMQLSRQMLKAEKQAAEEPAQSEDDAASGEADTAAATTPPNYYRITPVKKKEIP